jgi:hypothetical protein
MKKSIVLALAAVVAAMAMGVVYVLAARVFLMLQPGQQSPREPRFTIARSRPSAPLRKGAPELSGDLFTNTAVPHLSIEIPEEGMEVLRAYRWDWGRDNSERSNVLATVREGRRVYTNVALHLKGAAGSFRPVDAKPALTLNFDKLAEGQRFHGLQKFHLNNSVQDPTFLCEQISRELFLQAGVPAPRATHVTVELNGRELGLYVLVEGWNKQFLKRHFQDPKGNLYDGGFAKDINSPLQTNSGDDPPDRSDLQALVEAAQAPMSNRLGRLEEVLDMDRFLTFIALEVMLAHWDGYAMNRNNYRLYHDPATDQMVFLPHGLDQMFGVWRANPTSPITPQMRGLVARAVLAVPEGRRRYLDRMSQLRTNVYQVDAINARVDELAAKLRSVLKYDPIGGFSFERGVMNLRDRIARRGRSVQEQLAAVNTPLPFDSAGVARLSNWNTRRESGNPSFERKGNELHVRVDGGTGAGSWRRMELLEEGEYQFIGKVRTRGVSVSLGETRYGVTLRISGDRQAKMLAEAPEWTSVTNEFSAPGLLDVELVCEFRTSSGGEAWFDASSLKLVRKGGPRKP